MDRFGPKGQFLQHSTAVPGAFLIEDNDNNRYPKYAGKP
jgi:hypothetical protein